MVRACAFVCLTVCADEILPYTATTGAHKCALARVHTLVLTFPSNYHILFTQLWEHVGAEMQTFRLKRVDTTRQ